MHELPLLDHIYSYVHHFSYKEGNPLHGKPLGIHGFRRQGPCHTFSHMRNVYAHIGGHQFLLRNGNWPSQTGGRVGMHLDGKGVCIHVRSLLTKSVHIFDHKSEL